MAVRLRHLSPQQLFAGVVLAGAAAVSGWFAILLVPSVVSLFVGVALMQPLRRLAESPR